MEVKAQLFPAVRVIDKKKLEPTLIKREPGFRR